MTESESKLTADSTIGAWMAHPVGVRIVEGLTAKAGMDASALALLRNVPLSRLVAGQAPDEAVEAMVRQANGGFLPAPEEATGLGWQERVLPGRFEGETVIVTGAASGIGRAVASRVAREGGTVVAVDLSAERLGEFAASLPGTVVRPVAADITDTAAIERVVQAADGRIDGLANVAGMPDDFSAIHEVSDETLARVFDVNVFGLVKLTRAVVPFMMEARSGRIVNVSSEAALRGSSSGLAYTASKHAVIGVTRSTAFMYEPYGIRVNSVAPGGTLTGMRPPATESYGAQRVRSHVADVPIAVPESLAASITFLLSRDSINVTGALLPSDGGESVF